MSHHVRLSTPAIVIEPEDIAGVFLMVVFAYDPADPLAVTIALSFFGGDSATWTVSRDLLQDGLTGPSGAGDMEAFTDPETPRYYYVGFQVEDWPVVLSLSVHALKGFLSEVYRTVPEGTEFEDSDLDAELNAILRETT